MIKQNTTVKITWRVKELQMTVRKLKTSGLLLLFSLGITRRNKSFAILLFIL